MPAVNAWTLSIAGIPVSVRAEGPVNPAHVDARFGAFARAPWVDDLPGFALDVGVEAGWAPPRPVRAEIPGADVRWLDDARVELLRAWDLTVLDLRARRAESVCGPSVATVPVVDPTALDTPLRFIASLALPRHEGLLMHASGYADARGAVLFLAVSGGGKTTTARKLPHANVLSDDQVALRRVAGEWTAFALPFVGEYRRATVPRRAPLRAVVLLAKGEGAALARVPPAAAIASVMRCAVNFAPGPHNATLLDLAADLATRVPVHRLTLDRDAPVAPALDALLR